MKSLFEYISVTSWLYLKSTYVWWNLGSSRTQISNFFSVYYFKTNLVSWLYNLIINTGLSSPQPDYQYISDEFGLSLYRVIINRAQWSASEVFFALLVWVCLTERWVVRFDIDETGPIIIWSWSMLGRQISTYCWNADFSWIFCHARFHFV